MKIGPKYKICKRLGSAVFEKCQTQKFTVAEARSDKGKPRSNQSEFKRQLTEKQKMRYTYQITERQLSRYASESVTRGGEPQKQLVNKLESRLDNVVYRMGIAKTRALARQLVSHGHIMLNGRKNTVPSAQIVVGDIISVREGSRQSPLFQGHIEGTLETRAPQWMSVDLKALSGTKTAEPATDTQEYLYDPMLVLEYYSR